MPRGKKTFSANTHTGRASPKVWALSGGTSATIFRLADLKLRLLERRGLMRASADQFLQPDFDRDVHDPFLFLGMELVVERLARAAKQQEHVVVYGDYDVDGVSASALMVSVLRRLQIKVSPYIPHRLHDGYGLSMPVVHGLASQADLFITVDCGVANLVEIAWLREQGKDVIVIDHHLFAPSGELPAALAVIHPRHPQGHYPFPHLSAAGVAWKVSQALALRKTSSQLSELDTRWLLDLAVLGTVADMVPMQGENRAVTYFGLKVLARTRRAGLRALLKQARVWGDEITEEHVGWRIAPQLNAAGKVDHAQPALDLLLAEGEHEVGDLVKVLGELNKRRQTVGAKIAQAAEAQIDLSQPVLIVSNMAWLPGLVGLAAGKLAEKYQRPAIVIGGNGSEAVGSARAPMGVDVVALLRAGEAHTLRLGGHARAAGLSLLPEQIPAFRAAVQQAGGELTVQPEQREEAEFVIAPAMIDRELLEFVTQLAPFGEGNRPPAFVARGVELVEWRPVGADGKHAKCVLNIGGEYIDAIGFGLAEAVTVCHGKIDILFSIEENNFKGRRSLQVNLVDVARADTVPIISDD